MTAQLEIQDDGFATVKIGDEEHVIDVWQVWGDVDNLRAQARDGGADFLQLTVEYLAGVGFKKQISHKAANAFLKWHSGLVAEVGKAVAGESKPDSPDSTVPTPSDSPPA